MTLQAADVGGSGEIGGIGKIGEIGKIGCTPITTENN